MCQYTQKGPLVMHLLDKWYVMSGTEEAFLCNSAEEVCVRNKHKHR